MSYLCIENQILMRKFLFIAFFCFSSIIFSFSQGVTYVATDSVGAPLDTTGLITVKNSHFLSKIIIIDIKLHHDISRRRRKKMYAHNFNLVLKGDKKQQ